MIRTRPYKPWLLSKLRKSDAQVASYLTAGWEDSPEMFLLAMRNCLESRQMARMARKVGIARSALYHSTSGNGNPTLKTLRGMMKALGLTVKIVPAAPEEKKP